MQDSPDHALQPENADEASGAALTGEVPFARPLLPEAITLARPWEHPILLPGMTRKAAWADLALVIILLLGWHVIMGTLLHAWVVFADLAPGDGEWTPELEQQVLFPGLAMRAAGVVFVIWLVVRRRRQSAASVGIPRRGWFVDVLLGTAGLFVVYGMLALVFLAVMTLWPEAAKQLSENAERLLDVVPPLSPSGFLLLAALIGLYEELFFRGFLMTRLRKATGSWLWAVLISTAVFTALHAGEQTSAALVLIAMLSLSFSILTITRRSIVPAIIAHALFDLSQFLILSMQKT
jgi:membrane protease YdiL (CAAX protease family)